MSWNDKKVANDKIKSEDWNDFVGDEARVSSDGCVFYNPLSRSFLDIPNNKSLCGNPNDVIEGTLTGFTRNDGTVSGGVTIEDGAMVFDGTTGYVDVPDDSALNFGTNDFTVSVWAKSTDVTTTQAVAHKKGDIGSNVQAGWGILIINDKWRMIISNGTTDYGNSDTGSLTDNTWTLFTIKKEGTKFYRIINGVAHDAGIDIAAGFDVTNIAKDLQIGRDITGRFFNGSIDQALIFNRALTEAEITELYNAGKDSYSPVGDGLVGQWSGKENDYAGTALLPTTIYDTNMVVKGQFDEALNFDGVDDFVDLGNNSAFNIENSKTISFWVENNLTSHTGMILNKRVSLPGWDIYQLNTEIIVRVDGDSGISFGGTFFLSANTLSLFTLVVNYETNVATVYRNGVSLNTRDISALGNVVSSQILTMGKRNSASPQFWNGSISQPLIINRALSEDEIKALYNRQRTYFTDNNPAGRLGNYAVKGDLIINQEWNDYTPTVTFAGGTADPTTSAIVHSKYTSQKNKTDLSLKWEITDATAGDRTTTIFTLPTTASRDTIQMAYSSVQATAGFVKAEIDASEGTITVTTTQANTGVIELNISYEEQL